jgi:formate-dependent nitrite reductase membrane component NrfD
MKTTGNKGKPEQPSFFGRLIVTAIIAIVVVFLLRRFILHR